MGWSSGSELVERVANVVCGVVDTPEARAEILDELVRAVLDLDCDTLDECRGIDPALDAAINEHWATENEEEED